MPTKYSRVGQDDFDLPQENLSFSNSLGDLFSSFTRHIGPAPNHERPDRSVQMRIYTLQKRHFLLVFSVFFALFCVAVLIGMASPSMVEENSYKGSQLNGSVLPRGPFVLRSPKLSRYNQQIWLGATIHIENRDREIFNKNFTVLLSLKGLNHQTQKSDPIGRPWHNRTRLLECSGTECKSLIALHLGYLSHNMYITNISLIGLKHVHESYKITEVVFTWSTYNPSFTELEIVFRFFFLLLSILVFVAYGSQIRKYPVQDWSLEQKWVSFLLLLLALYNNPLFPLTLSSLPLMAGAIDATLQSIFLFSLLLFWLCALHGLRQTNRNGVFYLPKLTLVFLLWLAALTMEITEEVNQVRDPTYSYQINTSHYTRFRYLFIFLLLTYILYTVFLIIRAFTELRSMQFIQTRLKFVTSFMLIIITLSISLVYAKFGRGMLEDNFIAQLYTSYDSVTQFVASYALLNLYVYMMAYMYSPCGQPPPSNNIMMGDSDEEVLYGDTEARKPLNSCDDEESD